MSPEAKPSPPPPPRRPSLRPVVDSVTTINTDGSHRFLFPADVRGRFSTGRRLAAYGLIAVYLLLPWVPVNGYPAVFLDIAERRFHLFGLTLAAQDAWLLFFGVSGLGFALFFLTALFGRLWCGWACPQTVFLDHVFRRIERWIEGDATERRALRAAPMSPAKFTRLVAKHGLYAVAALLITHLFLAYFVSLPELWLYMHEAPGEHWTAFVFVFVAAGLLYFNFAWFREQLCIVICPYGRLQSALTDDNTMVIGYDARRGEPRGKIHRSVSGVAALERSDRVDSGSIEAPPYRAAPSNAATLASRAVPSDLSAIGPATVEALAKEGDCIDCNRCVQVCPTGIDIRHGLQMECIGCAACVDACDEVMAKVDRPTGLVRYDSYAGLGGGATRWIRPRTIMYGILLLIGATVALFAFSTVKPASLQVYRMSGAAYFVGPNEVRDQFMVRLVNKRSVAVTLIVSAENTPASIRLTGFPAPVTLGPLAETVSPLVLVADRRDYHGPFKFSVKVTDAGGTFTLTREVEFMGPDARLLEEEDHENGLKR